jgi:hypothetical protein
MIHDYSHEMVGQLVKCFNSNPVGWSCPKFGKQRDSLGEIVRGNGAEFSCKTILFQQKESRAKLTITQTIKRTQNTFIEILIVSLEMGI